MHIRALVVEDNFDLAGTVIDYLEAAGVVYGYVRDGQAGFSLACANCYDVILLDAMLPRISGRQICRQLCEVDLQTPIFMLTILGTLQGKLGGFDVGADDYLLKPFELPELLVRLRALSRCRSGQAQCLQVDDLVMDLDSRQASCGGMPLALPPTAWRILECLMRASPALVTHEQLERSAWDDESPESSTLNVHIYHLRSTAGKGLATPLIHTLHSVGFQLERK